MTPCCDAQQFADDWTGSQNLAVYVPKSSVVRLRDEWVRPKADASSLASEFASPVRIEKFVGLELSLIPQVERVFINRSQDGRQFQVLTVVNDRDPEIRANIYKREQAIIDANADLEFDFHIISRMNRDLADVVGEGVGQLAFKR